MPIPSCIAGNYSSLRENIRNFVLSGPFADRTGRYAMDGIVYLVGLVVIVMFILSFLGLR